ncbi:hypothetical protein [Parvicella tangerina]|uniref:Uncharacterized protein n=1 Tax=Parvicella tangerina TaxID=2829795 RepID=A0A916JMK9_9FLAO|nr:hypothetical protein [Parvicella tangerina]CAG5081948.1 hypothetical protein CRYO30217_01769 [Parvicella tangerina]
MKYSKGYIRIKGDKIKITFNENRSDRSVRFSTDDIKEFATFRKRNTVDINKWVLGGIFLAVLILWIILSENLGYKEEFKKYDVIVMPATIILFFTTLFIDILGDTYFVRHLIRLLFFSWYKNYLIIMLKSGAELEIPVRNSKEAYRIMEVIENRP